jgi:hypothetical protein
MMVLRFQCVPPLMSHELTRPDDRGRPIGTAAKPPRENRTITVDFRDEATDCGWLEDRQAFLECVIAFPLSRGFQLQLKATCRDGGCLTRYAHDVCIRWGG